MKMVSKWTYTLSSALIVFAISACNDASSVQVEETKENPNQPAARVDLPDPPPASGFEVPERNNDKTLRVEGLIHYQEKYLDQSVEVSGEVMRISQKCDPKKAKKKGESCPEPNLFIKDDKDGQKVMRIVGYKPEFVKKAKLEVGQRHVFKGTYKKVAYGFVATEDGLILLDYLDDIPVVEPQK